jgi:aspartokinase
MRGIKRDLTVHKFGGASLADGRAMRNAVALAAGRDGRVAVVVSALAGVTDALLAAAAAVGKDTGLIEEIAATLARRHRQAILAVVPAGAVRQELLATADHALTSWRSSRGRRSSFGTCPRARWTRSSPAARRCRRGSSPRVSPRRDGRPCSWIRSA